MPNDKSSLQKAQKNKVDEFYTKYIYKELENYKEFLNNKIIYCNCDDYRTSNFFKYFVINFKSLKLKKLIATHYSDGYLWENRPAHKVEINNVEEDFDVDAFNIETLLSYKGNSVSILKGNGSFESGECISILKGVDIVVTNPPFSLFIDFINTLVKYNKDFIVIGNHVALAYNNIIKLYIEGKIKLGYNNESSGIEFELPDDTLMYSKIVDGKKVANIICLWYTSLPVKTERKQLCLTKKYNEEDYEKYVNFDAINVDSYKDIPYDYEGAIGVPINTLEHYDLSQWEILGTTNTLPLSLLPKLQEIKNGKPTKKYRKSTGTILIKYNPEKETKKVTYRNVETGELYKSVYSRVIIKRKKLEK